MLENRHEQKNECMYRRMHLSGCNFSESKVIDLSFLKQKTILDHSPSSADYCLFDGLFRFQ